MSDHLFCLIHKIARRNGSFICYPLESFIDEQDGNRYLTCSNLMFAETSPEWLFSDVTDEEANELLFAFLNRNCRCTYEVQRHLMRLMALKGRLVESPMEQIIETTDWKLYSSPSELLSYLAVKQDGCAWIMRLLDIVPNDARDGLFTACWYCKDLGVQRKLLNKFKEWSLESSWGLGDGEGCWLAQFLSKWIKRSVFPFKSLKELIVWHFAHLRL